MTGFVVHATYLKCNQCKSYTSASLVSVPGRVCWSGVWAHGPPSSGCLDDRWPSRAGHQPSPGCFLCAVWCVACRCESQTCDTRRTSTGPSPGPTQTDSLTEPLLSPEHLLPVCRWSSLIRLQQAERNHVSFGCFTFTVLWGQWVQCFFFLPVWSMFGPVFRVGVPLDWTCHLKPLSSDIQPQKEGSLAQPKSQANHRNATERTHRQRLLTYAYIILLVV